VLGVALTLAGARAQACIVEGAPFGLAGYPEDGATDVPLDVAPYFESYRARVEGGAVFTLEAADGSEVPLTVNQPYVWQFVLGFEGLLAPQTTYTLRAAAVDFDGQPLSEALVFTTGTGLSEAPRPPADTFIEHYSFASGLPQSSCDPSKQGTCLAAPAGTDFVLTYPAGSSYLYLITSGSFMIDLTGTDQETRCVELRSRAPNGILSEAVTRCREDGETFAITSGTPSTLHCTSNGLVYEGALMRGEPVSGDAGATGNTGNVSGELPHRYSTACTCGILVQKSDAAPGAWLASALCAASIVRRRRRGRA